MKLELDTTNQCIRVLSDSWIIYNVTISAKGIDAINYQLKSDSTGTNELSLQKCDDDYDCIGDFSYLLNFDECFANVYIKKDGIPLYEQQKYRNYIFRFNPKDSISRQYKIKVK